MDKRRVIQLAHKTLVVSLPSKWAKNHGIAKGTELEVEERGKQISFFTEKRSEEEKISLDFSQFNSKVISRWVMASLHKSGYDEIEVTYKEPEVISTIQKTINEILIGYAIVDQGRNRCTIRMVAEEQEREFENMLRRAFLVAKNMGESTHQILKEGGRDGLKETLLLERTCDQLTNYCERILNKKGHKDYRKTSFAYVVAWNLEKICDHYKEICMFFLNNTKEKPGKETLELLRRANEYFAKYYELLYKFDINKLTQLSTEKEELNEKAEKIIRKGGADAIMASTLKEFVTKVSDFSASFIALNTS